jgi:hypothetical protein
MSAEMFEYVNANSTDLFAYNMINLTFLTYKARLTTTQSQGDIYARMSQTLLCTSSLRTPSSLRFRPRTLFLIISPFFSRLLSLPPAACGSCNCPDFSPRVGGPQSPFRLLNVVSAKGFLRCLGLLLLGLLLWHLLLFSFLQFLLLSIPFVRAKLVLRRPKSAGQSWQKIFLLNYLFLDLLFINPRSILRSPVQPRFFRGVLWFCHPSFNLCPSALLLLNSLHLLLFMVL